MSSKKKQLRLAREHHTCSCAFRRLVFDWATTTIIDADFENSNQPNLGEARILWVVTRCMKCDGRILHGASFTDYRVTGEALLDNAIEKAVLWIIGSCEATGCKISSAAKRIEFEKTLQKIWQLYH